MDNKNVENSIKDLIAATGGTNAPAPAANNGESKTNEMKKARPAKPGVYYKWNKDSEAWVEMTDAEKKAYDDREAKRGKHSNLLDRARTAKTHVAKLALKQALSKRARIAAYVVNTDSKFEITAKKEKGTTDYKFDVVNRAPSSIKAVVITIPAVLSSLMPLVDADSDSQDLADKLNSIAATNEDTGAVSILVKPWSEFARFLQNDCAGYLHEDDAIFTEYRDRKNRIYKTPADIEKGNLPTSGSFVYLKYMTAKSKMNREARVYTIKHSIRAKILAPGNYIAMKRWQTEVIKSQYSTQEARTMIEAHLDRFTKSHQTKDGVTTQPIVSRLTTQAKVLVTAKDNAIESSRFFSTNAGESWVNMKSEDGKNNGVDHWFDKTVENNTVVPVKVARASVALVKKEKGGKDNNRYIAQSDALRLADASSGVYKFDATTFPKITKALKNHADDTFNAIQETLKSNRGNNSNRAKKDPIQKTYTYSGGDMVSLNLEDIASMLTENA